MLTLGKSPISLLQEYCDKLKLPHPHYEYTKLYSQFGFNCKCVHVGSASWGFGGDIKTAKRAAALKMCLAVQILSPEHAQEVGEELAKPAALEKSPWSRNESTNEYEKRKPLPILMAEEHINGEKSQWESNGLVPHHDEGIQDEMWYGLNRRMQLLEERECRREREMESVLKKLRQFQQGYVSVLEDIQQALKGHQHAIWGQQKELEGLRVGDTIARRLGDVAGRLAALVQAFDDDKTQDSLDVINDDDDLADWIREVDDLRLRWLATEESEVTSSENSSTGGRPSMTSSALERHEFS